MCRTQMSQCASRNQARDTRQLPTCRQSSAVTGCLCARRKTPATTAWAAAFKVQATEAKNLRKQMEDIAILLQCACCLEKKNSDSVTFGCGHIFCARPECTSQLILRLLCCYFPSETIWCSHGVRCWCCSGRCARPNCVTGRHSAFGSTIRQHLTACYT